MLHNFNLTKEQLGYLLFALGSINIFFAYLNPVLQEIRKSKLRVRAINKKYDFDKLIRDIENKRWLDSHNRNTHDFKLFCSKTNQNPNGFSASAPMPQQRD